VGGLLLEPVVVSLDQEMHFLVVGPNRSGKSTALATIAASLRAADPSLELYLLAPRRSPLTGMDVWTKSAQGGEAVATLAADLKERLAEREWGDDPLVVVIDDGQDIADSTTTAALEELAKRGRDVGVVLVGAAESNAATRAYSGWIPEVKKDRHGLLLQPDPDVDGDILGVELTRSSRGFPVGRGFLVADGAAGRIQVAAEVV
jgi:DNA segregation ATPase FtsK/SpoIIIE, S-DNA-T family